MTEQKSPASSYCTAFVLSIAWGIGCALVVIALFTAYDEILDARTRGNAPSVPSERIVVTPSGKPLIQVVGATSQIRTLDAERNPVVSDASELTLHPTQLRDMGINSWLFRRYLYQLDRKRIEVMSTGDASTDWFFVLEDVTAGRGQFVGYDTKTCLPVGYLGPSGFQNEPIPQGDQFEVDLPLFLDWMQPGIIARYELEQLYRDYDDGRIAFIGDYPLTKSQILMQTKAGVYLIDFNKKTIDAPLSGKDVIGLGIASQVVEYSGIPKDKALGTPPTHLLMLSLVARTPDSVIYFRPLRGDRMEYRLPKDFAQQRLDLYRPADDTLILLTYVEGSSRELQPGVGEFKTDYTRISPGGEIIEQRILALRHPRGIGHVTDRTAMNVAALAVPGTFPTSLTGIVLWSLAGGPSDPDALSDRFVLYFGLTWPAILIATLISAGLCWFVVRRQTAYHLPRSYGWLAFVFLLGVPGYLGYRCHRKWPVKERPAAPVRTGCEVFAA